MLVMKQVDVGTDKIVTCEWTVDEHFSKIVWVPRPGEETISDEPLPGSENKIFLSVRGVVEPDAEAEHGDDEAHVQGTDLCIGASGQEDNVDPEAETHPNKQVDSRS